MIKCWEFFHCKNSDCPAYRQDDLSCWLTSGPHHRGAAPKDLFEIMERCMACEVFRANMDTESLNEALEIMAGEHNRFQRLADRKEKEINDISMEMALGLSEVFEALQRISKGDPRVRIPEDSSLELIVKLKQLVNKTAENLGEIVDLSHEFAIGLAEHFDVLHRLAAGDLTARVGGQSQVELLESLKKVTNQMIDSVARDMSDRANAEEAIKQSEEKYRTLVENIQDGVFILQDEKMQFANEALAGITGYAIDEIVGFGYGKLVAPEDHAVVSSRYLSRISEDDVEQEYELRLLHKDGHTRVIVNMTVATFSYRGRLAILGTVKDITKQRSADAEKRKLESQLQRSQKMEAIGTLAGGVAHDLNNILSGIVSYPELLLLDLPDGSPLKNPILTIKRSGEKAAAIVQDLLTLARRGVAVTDVLDLNRVITDYLETPEFKNLTSYHHRVTVETFLDPELLFIMGSSVHLSKTVMNLLSNAAEAMPDGGSILLKTGNRYVDRPVRGYDEVKEGDYVTLTVEDNGIGISAEDMDRIFEPFYTKKIMGRSGTGLGMAVVWGTVKDHDGYIDARSVKGEGTTFVLYFPVSREGMKKAHPEASITDYMGRGESILVVDDVREQREIATGILKRLGYSVRTLSSGEEAVRFVKDNAVDLIVLDMIMDPGIDGYETYRQILDICPEQRVVIASGFSETDRVKMARDLGAGIYLKKPYTIAKLGKAVQSELKHR